jgi:hypothetical protein
MTAPRQPADHKSKPKPFTFKAPGLDEGGETITKTHTLPFASKGRENITGRQMRDALMDGDVGKLTLGFVLLEACGAKQDAIDAIYDLPNNECLEILGEWMEYGDGDGASLGK